jgi:hypothetical protein
MFDDKVGTVSQYHPFELASGLALSRQRSALDDRGKQ